MQREFEYRVKDAYDILNNCGTSLSWVHNSENLKEFLHYVLDLGNTINKGYETNNSSIGY